MSIRTPNPKGLTHEQIRQAAEAWYARQIAILQQSYGPSWPHFREWLEDYLKEELRERLIACGWRPKA